MIWFTGDTHGNYDISKLKSDKTRDISRDDFVIISGDFGLVWNMKDEDKNLYWRNWLDEKNFTTLFVPGNHENYDRLYSDEFEEIDMFEGKVKRIGKKIFMLQNGYVYNIDNKKVFTFGGAQSIDKGSRHEHISWWQEEIPSASQFFMGMENLSKNNFDVDVVVSHATHKTTFEKISHYLDMKFPGMSLIKNEDPLHNMLEEFRKLLTYKLWVCGHYHINSYDFGSKTVILYNIVKQYDWLLKTVNSGNENFYLNKV